MPDEEPFDETHPFAAPSPTTTASDLLWIVEEIQERKRLLDVQLLAMLPNRVASDVIKTCEGYASGEQRSGIFQMNNSVLVDKLPCKVLMVLDKDGDLLNSCGRIRQQLGERVQGILTHLGFKCQVSAIDGFLKIEMSW